MLQPKRTKFRKAHKGRIHGLAKGGTKLINNSSIKYLKKMLLFLRLRYVMCLLWAVGVPTAVHDAENF